ncbi:DUF2325 domain-containing protein [Roseateles sp. BYS180W]|uniref:DUF2325 domain-containing protein n=1 Tax=Roseateles rivi TaxID=3299028 RepID=A0ABW7FRQ7_9BURK
MPVLRRVLGKLGDINVSPSDYELHCGAINEGAHRTPVSEALQKELDRRYATALRLAAQHKTAEALSRWWTACLSGQDVAGSLWATLTHARCDAALQERVLRDIHMLQHQVGAANRADLQRLEALSEENAVLGRELAQAQARSTLALAQRARELEEEQTKTLKLRAELMRQNTRLDCLQQELAALEAAAPGLRSRMDQARELNLQQERLHELERALLLAQQQNERLRQHNAELRQALQHQRDRGPSAQAQHESELLELGDCAVLCVGGRPAVVPVYRQLIERTGGRFLHHDGGEEDAVAMLDKSLAAADLVICQTGCISHDAYWRVKDHCKRTGKRCVFVDKPSASSLQKALLHIRQELTSVNTEANSAKPDAR